MYTIQKIKKEYFWIFFGLFVYSQHLQAQETRTENEIMLANYKDLLENDLDSLETAFKALPTCEQVAWINEKFINNTKEDYLFYDCVLPLSMMLKILAAKSHVSSADGTTLGLMWSNKQIKKDIKAWKKHYNCK